MQLSTSILKHVQQVLKSDDFVEDTRFTTNTQHKY